MENTASLKEVFEQVKKIALDNNIKGTVSVETRICSYGTNDEKVGIQWNCALFEGTQIVFHLMSSPSTEHLFMKLNNWLNERKAEQTKTDDVIVDTLITE